MNLWKESATVNGQFLRGYSPSGYTAKTEASTVPATSPYQLELEERISPGSTITATIAGVTAEVRPWSYAVQAGELAVDRENGLLRFNAADVGLAVSVTYTPIGTNLSPAKIEAITNPTAHNHDDRYYTETEVDTALAAKADLVGGKVPTAQLPALVMTDVNSVASEAAQLALTAEEGDVAIRTDLSKTYVHNGGTAGTMADWSELATPTDAVTSVNGQTGVVSLAAADVGAAATVHMHSAADITSGTLDDARLPAEVPLTDEANTFTAKQTMSGGFAIGGSYSGFTLLTAGNRSVTVATTAITSTTDQVIVSFSGDVPLGTTPPYVCNVIANTSFDIRVETALASDINVLWKIVNS